MKRIDVLLDNSGVFRKLAIFSLLTLNACGVRTSPSCSAGLTANPGIVQKEIRSFGGFIESQEYVRPEDAVGGKPLPAPALRNRQCSARFFPEGNGQALTAWTADACLFPSYAVNYVAHVYFDKGYVRLPLRYAPQERARAFIDAVRTQVSEEAAAEVVATYAFPVRMSEVFPDAAVAKTIGFAQTHVARFEIASLSGVQGARLGPWLARAKKFEEEKRKAALPSIDAGLKTRLAGWPQRIIDIQNALAPLPGAQLISDLASCGRPPAPGEPAVPRVLCEKAKLLLDTSREHLKAAAHGVDINALAEKDPGFLAKLEEDARGKVRAALDDFAHISASLGQSNASLSVTSNYFLGKPDDTQDLGYFTVPYRSGSSLVRALTMSFTKNNVVTSLEESASTHLTRCLHRGSLVEVGGVFPILALGNQKCAESAGQSRALLPVKEVPDENEAAAVLVAAPQGNAPGALSSRSGPASNGSSGSGQARPQHESGKSLPETPGGIPSSEFRQESGRTRGDAGSQVLDHRGCSA